MTQERQGQEQLDELKAQLEQVRAEAERYLNNWRRAEADFANYKRRVDQEKEEIRRYGQAALIINILPILDDLERALGSLDARLAGLSWFDGIRLIYRKLQLALENAGVQEIPAEGQNFDPRVHEAIHYIEGEEGKVVAVVQKGYRLHDRVLRPAMVIVGKAPQRVESSEPQEEEERREQ